MIQDYTQFLRRHWRFVGYGLLLAFFSSFGQTFFISLFNEQICERFDLSDGEYGSIYSGATLASAIVIVFTGRLIDRFDLRIYTAVICGVFALACVGMSLVVNVAMLAVVIFLLRQCGQGLMSHTAATTMARYYDLERGKAISVAGLGYPLGEVSFPFIAVLVARAAGWRMTWAGIGIILVLGLIPLLLWFLRGHAERHAAYLERATRRHAANEDTDERGVRHRTRGYMLRDPRLYLVMPAVMAPGFIMTGFFFHQVHLCSVKGWDLALYTGCFIAFAGAQVPSSLLVGPLIDRFGATRLIPIVLLPLGGAMLTLALFDSMAAAVAYLMLAGLTGGIASPTVSAMWAEMYGTLHLGSIRSLVSSVLVLATAGSPALMGWLIDRGVTLETIAIWCSAYILGASLLTLAARAHKHRPDR